MDLKRLIAVARGDEPADLVFLNARVVNTFTGEIEECSVAVAEGRVAGVGDYREGRQVVDLRGRYLVPGLIDGHIHLESTYLHVDEYARAVVPRGVLGVVTDLHEMANVCGLEGVRYILRCARRLPLDLFLMAPSCVPCSPLCTSGASLGPGEIRKALRWREAVGLGEMMDFPAVIGGKEEALAKLAAARVRDGHAPLVMGRALNAYLCPLIASDHETTRLEEGKEKLRRGMFLMIREGSSEKNLEELLPLVDDRTYHRCLLVVDDRTARDLLRDGDVDGVVRRAIRLGLDPVRAVQMATLTPALHFRLEGFGAIAPGYWANLSVVEDLQGFSVLGVYYRGRLVAREGRALFRARRPDPGPFLDTVRVKPFSLEDLALHSSLEVMPVIEVIPGQIVTRRAEERPLRRDGAVVPDPGRDLLKLVVVERHQASGRMGKALVKGFGLKKGALATSVAHDSHNIVAVGADDESLYLALQEVIRNRGGLAAAAEGRVAASLALPLAGLLSLEPLEEVARRVEELERAAREWGCTVPSPFALLSFVALPVIPELKLTDLGLVDVTAGRLLAL